MKGIHEPGQGRWQSVAVRGRKNADEALALALASGLTVEAAAARAGVSARTAYRRRADPAFQQHAAELRAEMVQRAVGQLADGMADAAARLRELLRAEGESVCLGAARALLELGVKLRESTELQERLAALEARDKGRARR
jgi:hypothetical protein